MSNNKQSSIDFLIKQKEKWGLLINDDLRIAKAMHKEEHSKTWDDSIDNYLERGKNVVRHWSDFDEYYNDKYK